MKGYLLDSNIIIKNLRHQSYEEEMKALYGHFFLSIHVHYEIMVGIEKSGSPALRSKKLKTYKTLLSLFQILPYETAHAEEAAKVRAELEAKGRSIGPIDILIAAQARHMGFTMVTSNLKEFSRVEGLEVESWDS